MNVIYKSSNSEMTEIVIIHFQNIYKCFIYRIFDALFISSHFENGKSAALTVGGNALLGRQADSWGAVRQNGATRGTRSK